MNSVGSEVDQGDVKGDDDNDDDAAGVDEGMSSGLMDFDLEVEVVGDSCAVPETEEVCVAFHSDLFRSVQICSDPFRSVSDPFRCVQIRTDPFRFVQICSDPFIVASMRA